MNTIVGLCSNMGTTVLECQKMKRKAQKEKKFFIKENLYLIPVLGIILGIFVLPFLGKGRLEAYIISIYAIISAIYT